MVENAYFTFDQAILRDECHDVEDAQALYSEAARLFLEICKSCPDDNSGIRAEIMAKCNRCLNRAEELNGLRKNPTRDLLVVQSSNVGVSTRSRSPSFSAKQHVASPDGPKLTREELEILRETSNVNGKKYLPWTNADHEERFAFEEPFV